MISLKQPKKTLANRIRCAAPGRCKQTTGIPGGSCTRRATRDTARRWRRMTGCSCILRHYRRLAVQGGKGTTDVSRAPPRLLERAGTLPMIVATHGDTEGEYGFRDAHRPISPILKTDSGSTRDGWHGDGSRGILKARINPGDRCPHFVTSPRQARSSTTADGLQFWRKSPRRVWNLIQRPDCGRCFTRSLTSGALDAVAQPASPESDPMIADCAPG